MTKDFKRHYNKFKTILKGRRYHDGLLFKIIVYFLLIIIGFVFIYPILVMISYSFMSLEDLINPMVFQIPTKFYFSNYIMAWKSLDYVKIFFQSLLVTLIPALIQTFVDQAN